MSIYTQRRLAPGLYHIKENAGVFCTLITGRRKALLFDTGYGFADIREQVRALTDLPVIAVNSHCHLDHSGGSHFFEEVYAHPLEKKVYDSYQRDKKEILVSLACKYENGQIPPPWPEDFQPDSYLTYDDCKFLPLSEHHVFDLGGRTVDVIHLPGHTRGSVVAYDRQSGLLLSGDNIAQSLWIMFDHSAPLDEYRAHLLALRENYEISGIIASHAGRIYPPELIEAVIRCIDTRAEDRRPFFHPRKGYPALTRKMYAEGIGWIYLVYPLEDIKQEQTNC